MYKAIKLKKRINEHQKILEKKYPMSKIVLKELDNLITTKASAVEVSKWLKDYDNIIFSLEKHIEKIEDSKNIQP